VQVGGVSDTTTSTGIALTFNEAVTGLTASEIALTNGTGAATKSGEPTGSGTTWSLGISGVREGAITIKITHSGIDPEEKTVTVYKAPLSPGSLTFTAATTTASGFSATNVKGVTYGNNTFVAVGAGGKIAHSADGIIWTAATTTASGFGTADVNGVAYGGGKFIAVGGQDTTAKIATSTDGATWTAVTTPYIAGSLNSIAYGNNTFFAVGANRAISYSTDGGATWTVAYTVNSGFGSTAGILGVAYGSERFVAVGGSGHITYSGPEYDNVIQWVAASTINSGFGTSYGIYGVAYGSGKFFAVGQGGRVASSTDGTTWAQAASDIFSSEENNDIYGVAYDGSKFVAVGAAFDSNEGEFGAYIGKIASSANGTTWAQASADGSGFSIGIIRGIAYGGGTFVAVGDGGKIAYSNPQE
jgi:hypothetical protein